MQAPSDLSAPKSRLAAILFSDIVGSVELKQRLGAAAYERVLTRHNELFETGIAECAGSQVIKHTGDGYLACFSTASDAVRFALKFNSRIALEAWIPRPLQTRLCVHVGEVSMLDMAGRVDVVGLSADIAARIMSLAAPGQILLTHTAFNDARQFVRGSPDAAERTPPLRWMAHGPYLIKGSDEPIDVFEVGIEGISPLSPPPDSEKVKRVAAHDVEPTLGWRPGVGLEVPLRVGWRLHRKLGEGGFGEVWLAQNGRTKEKRVFKFCFDADRLRSFKRELTLFRLLRDALGDRKDIARLYDVKLDEAPFFVESEYTEGGNLAEWAEQQGGLQNIPLEQRLEIVAQVADAVAAAHSVGILHKDIKPSNILIQVEADGRIQPRLADFGIGILADRTQLQQRAITETGFTLITQNDSSRTGTRLYSPPESLRGKAFTIQGDIYALGVLLYQMAVGDLTRPLAGGWQRDISQPLLVDDIANFTDGDVARRVSSASQVAERIRSLPQRERQLLEAAASERLAAKRKQTVHRLKLATGVLLLSFVLFAGLAAWHILSLRAQQKQTEAALSVADEFIASVDPYGPITDKGRIIDSVQKIVITASQLSDDLGNSKALVLQKAGKLFNNLDECGRAEIVLQHAAAIQQQHVNADPLPLAETLNYLCWTKINLNQAKEARDCAQRSYDLRREVLGPTHYKTLESLGDVFAADRAVTGVDPGEDMFMKLVFMERNHQVPTTEETANFTKDLHALVDHLEVEMIANKDSDAQAQTLAYVQPFYDATNGNRYKFPLRLSYAAQWIARNGRPHAAVAIANVAAQLSTQLLPEGHGDRARTANILADLKKTENSNAADSKKG